MNLAPALHRFSQSCGSQKTAFRDDTRQLNETLCLFLFIKTD